MIMAIADYLNKILNAVYGKDVRQAIHDAIQQCYDDGVVVQNEVGNIYTKCVGKNFLTRNFESKNLENIQFKNFGEYDALIYNSASALPGGFRFIDIPNGMSYPAGKWRLTGKLYVEHNLSGTANVKFQYNTDVSQTNAVNITTKTIDRNAWVDLDAEFNFNPSSGSVYYLFVLLQGGLTATLKMKNLKLEYLSEDSCGIYTPAGVDVATTQYVDYLIGKLKADNNLN